MFANFDRRALLFLALLAACSHGGKRPSANASEASDTASRAVGGWHERILAPDGTLDWEAYARVADAYNTEEILQYRLGPRARDYDNDDDASLPEVYQPNPDGLWKGGTDRALA